ncbi:MAG: chorismate mutase [Ruminococcus sp.]|jgi:chorismate mutase/prephenate dehydratase|nr:chorismate mutase [Ruminococcus sp.]
MYFMELTDLRNKIDAIDEEILRLFRERMDVSSSVAEYKRTNNLPVFDAERENEVLKKFVGSEKVLWMDIMDISKAIQREQIYDPDDINKKIKLFVPENAKKIACQGIEGAYSETAADKIFSGRKEKIFFKEFSDVFDAVGNGEVDYGVLPFDNSTTGSVDTVYDLVDKNNCFIVSSVKIKIEHCLCGKNSDNISSKTVLSHEQALKQCSDFLKKHKLSTAICENTAAAAKKASENENILSVCSKSCGEKYGLSVIAENIANSKVNFTKFICISKNFELPKSADTISCIVTLPNTEGSLRRFLTSFHIAGCNLTSLTNRPIPDGSFDVRFHIDFTGNIHSPNISSLIRDFEKNYDFKFLGNY